ncbi:MAG: 2-hydroxychromene-2-carboxylate isomerase [Rhodoblastus sp.]
MSGTIDYYFTLVSPWAYIGHAAFTAVARKHGAKIVCKPVNLGEVFPQSGGLPLPKRHPLRLAYRIMELQRWREKRGLKFALAPKGWPFNPALADCAALAIIADGRDPEAYLLAAFRAAFEKEISLGEAENVARVLQESGHKDAGALIDAAQSPGMLAAYEANSRAALENGVFGSPSYVREGEVFWGQDRIDLLDDALTSGRKPYLAD